MAYSSLEEALRWNRNMRDGCSDESNPGSARENQRNTKGTVTHCPCQQGN